MTKFFTVLLIIAFYAIGVSQTTKIKLDYTVTYEIPNVKKGNDTITISFDKKGRYFLSQDAFLSKSLAQRFFKTKPKLIENAKMTILLDVSEKIIYLNLLSNKTHIFFQIDLDDFLPNKSPLDTLNNDNEASLVFEKTKEKITLDNTNYNLHKLYPSNEANEPLFIGFNKSMKFDMKWMLNLAINEVSRKKNINMSNDLKTENGIIMFVKDDKKVLLKAISISEKSKTIEFNNSFTIK